MAVFSRVTDAWQKRPLLAALVGGLFGFLAARADTWLDWVLAALVLAVLYLGGVLLARRDREAAITGSGEDH